MEKLLHEKLNDIKDKRVGRVELDGYEFLVRDDEAIHLAKEIEKQYIPRPRFENGEPLESGEEIDFHGRAEKVVSYLVAPDVRQDVEYGARSPYVTLHLKCGASYNVPLSEPLKRPTPKVLDADGVPCKSNDEVWSTNKDGVYEDGDMMIVVGIDAGVKEKQVLVRRALGGAGERWVTAKYLTHEKPVFDADNVRICKGDTVWIIESGYEQVIKEVGEDGCLTMSGTFPHPKMLTHQEPDSLKRLLNDIREYLATSPVIDSHAREWEKRFSALIERGN